MGGLSQQQLQHDGNLSVDFCLHALLAPAIMQWAAEFTLSSDGTQWVAGEVACDAAAQALRSFKDQALVDAGSDVEAQREVYSLVAETAAACIPSLPFILQGVFREWRARVVQYCSTVSVGITGSVSACEQQSGLKGQPAQQQQEQRRQHGWEQ